MAVKVLLQRLKITETVLTQHKISILNSYLIMLHYMTRPTVHSYIVQRYTELEKGTVKS